MLFLGVDGGGSKTAALLADEHGQVVGTGLGGAANYHIVGLEQTVASVRQAVEAALQGRTPDAVCYCMAAADMPYDFEQLRGALSALGLTCPAVVHNDVISIFRAGSRFPYGVGVVCGTGFNAGGISKAGREFRLPALGSVTGDRAGGAHLGMGAMGAAFRAWDGRGQQTMLADAILQTFNAPDFETLAERYVQHEIEYEVIVELAPLVFETAERGDPVAQTMIREQGIELGTAANAVLRRLELTGDDCDVVLGGSVIYGKGDLLMNTVNEVVHGVNPAAVVKRLDVPPVAGAVLLAGDLIGAAISDKFHTALRAGFRNDIN
jgi:N-acetylglucosamine kinase-like BadF-type ATPase